MLELLGCRRCRIVSGPIALQTESQKWPSINLVDEMVRLGWNQAWFHTISDLGGSQYMYIKQTHLNTSVWYVYVYLEMDHN